MGAEPQRQRRALQPRLRVLPAHRHKKATLFVDQKKLSPAIVEYLRREGVAVDDYDNVVQGLKDYFEYNILIDPDEVNYTLYKKVEREIVRRPSPLPFLKAVKTGLNSRFSPRNDT